MKKYIFILLTATLLFQGCNSWLEVKPSDRVSEDENFRSPQGFKMALNGIYIEMATNNLYGKNLSYDFVEVLANRYYINEKNADIYKLAKNFEYIHNTQKSILSSIWERGYFMIANINVILRNCETKRSILPDDTYAIVKGEALALRAMMHFDLMRLYGPTPNTRNMPCIPYYSEFSFTRPLNEGLNSLTVKILEDLDAAAKLLKPYDPVITHGRTNGDTEIFKNYRYFRLNYYAVKALEARVCLYSGSVDGMKERAYAAANEVIAAANMFPFTTQQQSDLTLENPDRSYTSEAIFSLQIPTKGSIYLATFNPSQSLENAYYVNYDYARSSCFENESADLRLKTWFSERKSIGNSDYFYFGKYKEGTDKENLMNQEYPLLRISEMYYIAAECETNPDKKLEYINTVRKNRGLSNRTSTTETNLRKYITSEYMRDLWGEGQLFFYYKRLELTSFRSGLDNETRDIELTKYTLPKPEGETQYDN